MSDHTIMYKLYDIINETKIVKVMVLLKFHMLFYMEFLELNIESNKKYNISRMISKKPFYACKSNFKFSMKIIIDD